MEDRKVLVLGIDGMDQRTTKRLVDEGKLPHIKKFIERGAARKNLDMLGALPTITPPCWTTLATGAYPGTHGITCYWKQAKDLDAVVYNMDSRNCKAEQLWNVTAEAGKKTLVWHWPGPSWPPSSDSENLTVVDGTQPGSVNMGIAQMDWEKLIVASIDIGKVSYLPKVDEQPGVGCVIGDVEELLEDPEDDEMMDLWWGDGARSGREIRTYVHDLDDTELMIGANVKYDAVTSPIEPADDIEGAPEGAQVFTILLCGGKLTRYGLITKNESGIYDTVTILRDKKYSDPVVSLKKGEFKGSIIDLATKDGKTKPASRCYKLIELEEDGSEIKLWISNALDIANDTLWSPKSFYQDIRTNVGEVPPVSLIGGEDEELAEEVFLPSWHYYNQWQADSLKYAIEEGGYEVIFSHLHNVDCAGHQFWHLAKTLEPWKDTDEKFYQQMIEKVYQQTDEYLGNFLPYLDQGWTIFIVSDHGLLVGENVPPILGEYGGLNVKVMKELGYTVLKKDENGNDIDEVDWEHTTAVQIRSNYIYINLKGRDPHGIVDPKDKYELEEKIISDLYNYRDPDTGGRIVGIALHNRDAAVLGLDGPDTGDIIFTINEGYNRLHGDGLSTARGAFETSTTPVFIAAGRGIQENVTTERRIRQVDVAPTIASVLNIRVPANCEGAPIYQILKVNNREERPDKWLYFCKGINTQQSQLLR